jgi:cytosine/adenosine deaminase-related metal-dependent hydrolase
VERTLIKNATIISVDPKIGDLHRGGILIEGSKIAAIAPSIPTSGAEIVHGTDRIAIPGFIDTHRHTCEALLRGTHCSDRSTESMRLTFPGVTLRRVCNVAASARSRLLLFGQVPPALATC